VERGCAAGERIEGVIGIPGEHLRPRDPSGGVGCLGDVPGRFSCFCGGFRPPPLEERLEEIPHGLCERLVPFLGGLLSSGRRKQAEVQIWVSF
jgi:hypothetical protein